MNPAPPSRTLILRAAAALFAALILAIGLVRAVLFLDDLANMNHIGGIWMTLAQSLNAGVFYPPLHDDGYYAGTRYMPLLFCLLAAAARLSGNYLIAAKSVALVALLGLLGATAAGTWRLTRRPLDVVAICGLVLAFPEGLRALLAPHADGLAVALSVAGVLAVAAAPTRTAWVGVAGILFALAFATKFSAMAAPAAAIIFLVGRHRKAAVALAAIEVVLILGVIGFCQLFSHGRFAENFRALGGGGMSFDTILIGPGRTVGALKISSQIAFVAPLVMPLALLTLYEHFRERRFTLWDWYFLTTLATTLVIFTSPGTDPNHLLELDVVGILVIAQRLAAPAAAAAPPKPLDAIATRVVVLAALVIAWFVLITAEPEERLPLATLAEQLPKELHLLTEDATPVVLLHQRPVVMDAFTFRLLAERGVIDDGPLVRRIEAREFNALVMLHRVDDAEDRLNRFHFTPEVQKALKKKYQFDQQVGQYFLYRPVAAADEH